MSSGGIVLTFQVERFQDIEVECAPLFFTHWREAALEHERIKLAPDWQGYAALQDAGVFIAVTVRTEGKKLVGYHFLFIRNHIHYESSGLMAYSDAYYVLPEYRAGGTGTKLFIATEKELRDRGVVEFYSSCKIHQDLTPMFEGLGFKKTDYMFRKAVR